jgi:hypothetical protein
VGYDDAKSFGDRRYTGMRVGGRHDWDYTEGRWEETKLSPDAWSVAFRSPKRRRWAAPEGSGAPAGTMFHWLLLAHQRVRKVDANTYETFLEGAKWKLAHRRPGWRRWSSEYRGQTPARERMIAILEETLARLKAESATRAPRIEAMLDPAVLGEPSARIEGWIEPSLDELLSQEPA